MPYSWAIRRLDVVATAVDLAFIQCVTLPLCAAGLPPTGIKQEDHRTHH